MEKNFEMPTLTMVVPMLLAYLFSGNGNMTGVIMSAGFAAMGFIWAIINYVYTSKLQKQQELRRQERYGEYLVQCADRIREKFNHNRDVRLALYPAADVCADYSEDTPNLWARTQNQSDFLFARMGLGDMPFQVKISAPKQEFTLVDDELAEMREYKAQYADMPYADYIKMKREKKGAKK